jgi:acetyltransferase-like isoleucine patch superfamily enzyme
MARALRICRNKLLGVLFRAPGIDLGEGYKIKGSRHIRFGRKFSAGRYLWLEAVVQYRDQRFNPLIELGDGVSLSENVHVSCIEHIAIRHNVLIGSKVYISDHQHGNYRGLEQSQPSEPPAARRLGGGGPVEIGENVWIGENVVIVGPAIIGEGAVIGANSVVTRDVAPRTMVAGSPVKVLKRFNSETCSWDKV